MAFSKAKLTRFNDITTNNPAPGTYNPNFDKRLRSCTPTSERGDKSPNGSVISDKASVTSTPCFRTPRLPARRKILCSQSARKYTTHEQENTASSQLIAQQREELQEKIVECMNKTQSIKDLEMQVEELQAQVSAMKQTDTKSNDEETKRIIEEHQTRIDCLTDEKTKLLVEIELMQAHYDQEISKLENNFLDATDKLQDMRSMLDEALEEKDTLVFENEERRIEIYDLISSNEELADEIYDLRLKVKNKSMLQEKLLKNQKRAQLLVQKLKVKQKNVSFLQKRITSIRKELSDLKTTTHTEISNLQQQLIAAEVAKNKEREEMEFGFLEVIQQLRSANIELTNNHHKEVNQHKERAQKHLQQIQTNANDQMHELQMKIEENILKHDMEMKSLKSILSDTERDLQFAIDSKQKLRAEIGQKKCVINELQRTLSATIVELNDVRENSSKEINELRTEIDNINNKTRRYAIALEETRSTVQVVTNRLVESDHGVEQLKAELEKLEHAKIQIENENNDLKKMARHLEEVNASLNANKLVQMDVIREEINNEKRALTDAIENYKHVALNAIKSHEQKQQVWMNSLNELTAKYHLLEKSSSEKIQVLEKQCENHAANNKELLGQLKTGERKIMEAQSLISASKIEIEHQDAEITELKFKINRLESQIVCLQGPAHKTKVDKLKEENKQLKDQLKNIEELPKYKELLEKFKEISMQATKDKKEKQEMEAKIRAQNKLIEKLKQEVTSPKSSRRSKLVASEKENQSPGKVAAILTESPKTTPLKDRNIRQ